MFILDISGVSTSASTPPGVDSAPDASENRSGSKGFRGVVNDGFRNCGAGVELEFMKELVGF